MTSGCDWFDFRVCIVHMLVGTSITYFLVLMK